MRILILSDRGVYGGGGAEAVAGAQAEELKRQGCQVLVCTGDNLPQYSERTRNYRCIYNSAGVALVREALVNFKPDVVHAHNVHEKLSFAVLKVAKKFGAKVFLTAHDTYLFYPGKYVGRVGFFSQLLKQRFRFNPLRSFLIKRYVRYCDSVFAVSDALGKVLAANGIPNTTLHNGIDVSKYSYSEKLRLEGRARFNLGSAPTILWAGRLSGLKGGAVIDDIIRYVHAQVPDAFLLKVGGVLRVNPEEMPLVYAAADVVITPSVYLDPFNLINIEAGAMSRPVVGTNTGGTCEIIEDGVTGFVSDPYSTVFAERVVQLLQNHALAAEMGRKANERVRRNFSLPEQVKKMIQLYTL